MAYVALERQLGNTREARGVYKRGYSRKLEEGGQAALCEAWLRFEREEGRWVGGGRGGVGWQVGGWVNVGRGGRWSQGWHGALGVKSIMGSAASSLLPNSACQ